MNPAFAVPLAAIVFGTLVLAPEMPRPKTPRAHVDPAQLASEYPMGYLGYPVGTYVQIEGVRQEQGKVGTHTLLVDTLCGEKLKSPVPIWLDNLKPPGLPTGKRCVLRGYESVRMVGVPDGVAKAENLPVPQAAWHMERYFIITSVLEPASLEKQ